MMLDEEMEISAFRQLLPPLLDAVRQCLTSGDDDIAITAFDILDDMVECTVPILKGQTQTLNSFMLEIAANKTVQLNTREKAANFVQMLWQYKSKVMVKQQLVDPSMTVLYQLCAEDDTDVDEDDTSAHTFASQCLDVIINVAPSKIVFPIIVRNTQHCMAHPDPNYRRAALTVLAVAAEGYLVPDALPSLPRCFRP